MWKALGATVMAVGLCAALAGGATAGGSMAGGVGDLRVSGDYGVQEGGFGTTDCVPLDDVRLRCTTTGFTSDYSGDLVGSSTASFEQVIDCAHGRTVGRGLETFEGSVRGGRPGTLTWTLVFTADFDCTQFFPSSLHIVGVVVKGTGGLAHTRGALLFDDSHYVGVLT